MDAANLRLLGFKIRGKVNQLCWVVQRFWAGAILWRLGSFAALWKLDLEKEKDGEAA